MKIKEIYPLFESPQMVQDTQFGLNNYEANIAKAQQLLKKKSEVIEDSADYEIFRSGNDRDGNIALLDKKHQKLDYLVHYSAKNYKFIGATVTQLLLWRQTGSPYVQGLTKRIFFNYLLRKYPGILSDGQQTDRGREFWLNRMAEATTLGYKVALVNMNNQQIIWYDNHMDYTEWLKTNSQWGNEEKYQALRYLIAN